jgi:hypothetical protein
MFDMVLGDSLIVRDVICTVRCGNARVHKI